MNYTERLFIDFLKSRNLYEAFLDNNAKDTRWNLTEDPYLYLSGAFEWSETPEGDEYWRNINGDWHDFLERMSDND